MSNKKTSTKGLQLATLSFGVAITIGIFYLTGQLYNWYFTASFGVNPFVFALSTDQAMLYGALEILHLSDTNLPALFGYIDLTLIFYIIVFEFFPIVGKWTRKRLDLSSDNVLLDSYMNLTTRMILRLLNIICVIILVVISLNALMQAVQNSALISAKGQVENYNKRVKSDESKTMPSIIKYSLQPNELSTISNAIIIAARKNGVALYSKSGVIELLNNSNVKEIIVSKGLLNPKAMHI